MKRALDAGLDAHGTNGSLTDVKGIRVGHDTLTGRPTGCTVILCEAGAVAGCDVRGGAPGTRETELMHPSRTVQEVHGICLSGGSAFGLDAAGGVMRYLEEQGVGFDALVARVPIVPAAVLFDLQIGTNPQLRPDAESGYRAAQAATTKAVQEGSIGAGAGATVGKVGGFDLAMKGGIGSASVKLPDGLVVAALVAVNAEGDVIDPSGDIVAGARTTDGATLADARKLLRAKIAGVDWESSTPQNTTLGVVATNARLTKPQATVVAQMAHDGFARSLAPSHSPNDGDVCFAIATGSLPSPASTSVIGALAAEMTAVAIVRAARTATGLPGFPSASEFARERAKAQKA